MDSFQQQAFNFKTPNLDFDPNKIPADGEQYLQKVFHERAKCSTVVVKPIINKSATSVASVWNKYTNKDIDCTAQSVLLPTKEWFRIQTSTFNELRHKIAILRLSNKFQPNALTDPGAPLNLPDEYDDVAWQNYCRNNRPFLRIMFQIHQRTLEKLIEYQSNWFIENTEYYVKNNNWLSPWIYSCLACIHLPLEPNMHSILRDIAKTCIRLRNQMSDTDINDALPLNLLICIVSRNFNQLDLCGRTQ